MNEMKCFTQNIINKISNYILLLKRKKENGTKLSCYKQNDCKLTWTFTQLYNTIMNIIYMLISIWHSDMVMNN